MKLFEQIAQKHIIKKRNLYKSINQSLKIDQKLFDRLHVVAHFQESQAILFEKGLEYLRKHFNNVSMTIFHPEPINLPYVQKAYNKSDFNIFKWLKEEPWEENRIRQQVDLLLVYNPQKLIEIEVIASGMDAQVRLGMHQTYEDLYNILIDIPGEPDFRLFLLEVMKLIKSLISYDQSR